MNKSVPVYSLQVKREAMFGTISFGTSIVTERPLGGLLLRLANVLATAIKYYRTYAAKFIGKNPRVTRDSKRIKRGRTSNQQMFLSVYKSIIVLAL